MKDTTLVKAVLFIAVAVMGVVIFSSCGVKRHATLAAAATITRPPALDAVGMWRIPTPNGEHYFTLNKDGLGIQTNTSTTDRGGQWVKVDDAIHTYWNDGWVDVLSYENGQYISASYPPGVELDEAPIAKTVVEKVGGKRVVEHTSKSWGQWVMQDGCKEDLPLQVS